MKFLSDIDTQNLPQLVLQSIFLISSNGANEGIAISSIIFSSISIIVSILSMTMERTIDFTQSYAVITMNVTGDCVRKRAKQCRLMCKRLQEEFAVIIGVEKNTIEMIKPTSITNGFMIKFHVYVNDKVNTRIDFEKILNEANDKDKLAEIIKESWILEDDPEVKDIQCIVIESKEQRINSEITTDNTVEMLEAQIAVDSVSTVANKTNE